MIPRGGGKERGRWGKGTRVRIGGAEGRGDEGEERERRGGGEGDVRGR